MAIAAGTTIGRFRAVLGLDTADYARGILNAEAMNRVFGQSFSAFVSNPLLGSIDILKNAVAGFARYSAKLLATAEDVQRLAQQTGVGVEAIQALRKQMELAGKDAGGADDAVRFLARSLGEARREAGPAKDAFRELGIDIDSIGTSEDGLRAVLDALSGIDDAGVRSSLAMKLLGRNAGPELVNAVGGGAKALDELIERGLRLRTVLGKQTVNDLEELNSLLGKTAQIRDGLAQGATAAFFSGFRQEFDTSEESLARFAAGLNDRLIPIAERLGKAVGEAAGSIDDLLIRLDKLIAKLEQFGEGVAFITDDWDDVAGTGISKSQALTHSLGIRAPSPRTTHRDMDLGERIYMNLFRGMW